MGEMTNFQFSIYFALRNALRAGNQFSKRQILKLGLVSLAATAVGASVVLVLNYQTLKESLPEENTSPMEETEEPKIATYSGTIKPLGSPVSEGGTHFLEGVAGEIIAILKGVKIDLSFFEGQTVGVEGTIKGDVLEVEKIIL